MKAVLSATDKGFSSTMNSAVKSVESLDDSTSTASSGILSMSTAFAVAQKAVDLVCSAISSSISSAVSRVDTLNQFPKIMEQMGFSAEESEASINKLSEGIDGLPTSLDGIVSSTQSIALLTGDLDTATDTALALNDAFLASGSSTAEAERGLTQYTQMLSKGKVDQQSWNTLCETMGYALTEVAEAFGYAGSSAKNDLYSALQSGEITFDELNAKLVELDTAVGGFAEVAVTASAGIATSWQNIQTAVTKGVANVIQAIDDGLESNGLPTFVDQLGMVKDAVNTTFSAAATAAGTLTNVVAPAVKLVGNNLDVLTPALATAAAGFVALKVVESTTSQMKKFSTAQEEAVKKLKSAKSALELAATAEKANEKATKAAKTATTLATKATQLEEDALKARTTASKLAKQATEAQKKADKAGASATELKADAEKAAATAAKARESADKKAQAATTARSNADRAATISEKASTAATEANAAATAASSTTISIKTALLGVLSGEISVVTVAQTAWNAAMNANPIGTIITLVTAATTVLTAITKAISKTEAAQKTLTSRSKKLAEETEELNDALEESADAYEDNVKSAKSAGDSALNMASSVATLVKQESRSADEKALLATYVEELNSAMDDLNLAYDEEADKLNMTTEALEAKAEAYKAQQEYTVYAERYNEILEEQIDIDEQLTEAQELYNEAQEKVNNSTSSGSSLADLYSIKLSDQAKQLEELQETKDSYAQQEEDLLSQMTSANAAYNEAYQTYLQEQESALAENIENQTVSLEDLSEENQETVNELSSMWQDYCDLATDMFDTLSDSQEMSVDEMIANLEENQRIINEWGDNMESLRDRFDELNLSEGVLDDLADMGPEGAGYVAALVSASDEQLTSLASTYDEGGTVAKESLLESLGVDSSEIPEAIAGLITQAETSLRETVDATDWSSLGSDITSGLAEGLSDTESTYEAGTELGESVEEGVRDATETHSPSAVAEEIGVEFVEGLANGLGNSSAAVSAAQSAAENVINAVNSSLKSANFSSAAKTAFNSISTAANTSMTTLKSTVTKGVSACNAAISSGMTKSTSTVSTAMTKITSTITTKLTSIQSNVKSKTNTINTTISSAMTKAQKNVTNGMTKINSAMKSGMSSAASAASSGCTKIVSAFSSLYSKLYSSGSYAMSGLAAGIKANSGTAISAAKAVANSISATINSALDIGSPSRVTEYSGKMVDAGAAKGILGSLSVVKRAAAKLSEAMTPAAISDFSSVSQKYALAGASDLNVTYEASGMFADLLGTLRDLRDSISDDGNRTYQFEVTQNIDGREFAKATASYTQAELETIQKRENRKKGVV